MHSFILAALLIGFTGNINSAASAPKPKYGPEITLLSKSHEYIRENIAPDYWAISPFYLPQQNDRSCSVASVAMLMNAVRREVEMTADDELITQMSLLKTVNSAQWKKNVGPFGKGVTLNELGKFVESSLKAYGVANTVVTVVHVNENSKEVLHEALVKNEASDKNFMIINFIQGIYTGDTMAGHIAPVGAYDSKRKKVLVMDPDRQWYEPYWVSEETLLKGMNTLDKTSRLNRGYIFIEMK